MHRRLIAVFTVAALLFAAVDAALWHRARQLRELQSQWDALAATVSIDPPRFRATMVATLPAPARRYLRHAIALGAPLRATVRMNMAGRMSARPGGRRAAFSAREVLVPGRGFVWRARIQRRPLSLTRTEAYLDGTGRRSVALLGVVPWRHRDGADASIGNRAVLALQSIWDPAALLPFRGVQWKAMDATHAVAVIEIDGRGVPLTLEVSARGELRAASVPCPRTDDPGGRLRLRVRRQMRVAGFRVPSRVSAGWQTATGADRPIAETVILAAEYR
ncbi:MAG TPA: DUF6544 family protein [Gammaproteobacteria bacterium]|nr:DUF6544 family protein [Gammaproteobacteria bacterium]